MAKKQNQLPEKLVQAVEQSGIELNVAEKIASEYAPFMIKAQEIASGLKGLKKEVAEDAVKAKRIRIDLGKIPAPCAEVKKAHKEKLLVQTRFIDGLFNTVEGYVRLSQEEAKEIELHQERIEEQRIAGIQKEREEELSTYEMEMIPTNLGSMDVVVWEALKQGVIMNFQEKEKAREVAKLESIRVERQLELSKYGEVVGLTIDTTEEEYATLLVDAKEAKKKADLLVKQQAEENKKLKEKEEKRSEREKIALPLSFHIENYSTIFDKSDEEFDAIIKAAQEKQKAKQDEQKKINEMNFRIQQIAPYQEFITKPQKPEYWKDLSEEKYREIYDALVAKKKAKDDAVTKALEDAKRIKDEQLAKEKAEKELKESSRENRLNLWIESMEVAPPEGLESDIVVKEIMEKFNGFKGWAKKQIV